MSAPQLVVALDVGDAASAVSLARDLRGLSDEVQWLKVGLELYVAEGPDVVARLKDMGFRVFCDLKFHDIPNTVAGAVASCTRAGADMLNVHAAGGPEMLAAARESANRTAQHMGRSAPVLLAVTVLTSMDADDLAVYCPGAPPEPATLVPALAVQTFDAGLDGVVCSAHEAAAVKAATTTSFGCLCPGIRPLAAATHDQKRVMTPTRAVQAGADWLVVGRAITGAKDPAAAASAIMSEMRATRPNDTDEASTA